MDVGAPEVGLNGPYPLATQAGGLGAFSAILVQEAASPLASALRFIFAPNSSMIKTLDGLSEGVGVGFNEAQVWGC
jgi:hypothetical protein